MSKGIFSGHIEQIWNNKDVSGIERLIARDYRGFDGAEVISGLEGYKEHFTTVTTGFPDLQITIRDLQEESRVAARFSVNATHTGEDLEVTGGEGRDDLSHCVLTDKGAGSGCPGCVDLGYAPEPAESPGCG